MFARATRPLFHRALHTASRRSTPTRNIIALSLGASAVAATYVTWRLNSQCIALDSPPSGATKTKTSTRSASADITTHTPEKSLKDQETPSESGSTSEGQATQAGGANQGAYNPETGEINWDCPCLGGMAHGPCGMEFREAFSCFVYSEEEPKGINCVEKFKAMQDCFRAHPEVYADEIMDDDDDDEQATNTEEASTPATDVAVVAQNTSAQS